MGGRALNVAHPTTTWRTPYSQRLFDTPVVGGGNGQGCVATADVDGMRTLRCTRHPRSAGGPRGCRRTWPAQLLVVTMLAVVLTPTAALGAPRWAPQERQFLELMNEARRSRGLTELVATPAVASVARRWSKTMAADGDLRHNPNVGDQLTIRWTRWGENVGWASNANGGDLAKLTARLHRGFMDSDGHRANILGAFNQVGVGVALDGSGTMWATMVFVDGPLDTVAPEPKGLTDIAGTAHRRAITAAWERGLIDACDGGRRFCPRRHASRAAVATTVARMLELEPSATKHFADVSGRSHINALAEAGVVNGCSTRRFCPERAVTRAQLASMLVRGLADLTPVDGDRFADLPPGYVHAASINALAEAGVTRGCDDTRFCPTTKVTRAQLASFVIRALER